VNFALIDTLGTLIVLSTIVAAIALIFTAYMLVRPGWRFATRNGVVLVALIVDLLVSLRVFEPSILRRMGPLVEPGTELLYCFVLPVLVLTIALFAWPHMRAVNDDMPISWTIWPQTFRAIGGVFLVYWAAGHMPGGFALPAGIGDLLVGLTAPWMTLYILRGGYSKRVLVLWNLLGVLDFVIAFATGFAFNTPTAYPLVLVPGFLVPLALGFHLHSLRKLYRLDGS
jgi:hypothetical protein